MGLSSSFNALIGRQVVRFRYSMTNGVSLFNGQTRRLILQLGKGDTINVIFRDQTSTNSGRVTRKAISDKQLICVFVTTARVFSGATIVFRHAKHGHAHSNKRVMNTNAVMNLTTANANVTRVHSHATMNGRTMNSLFLLDVTFDSYKRNRDKYSKVVTTVQ